MAHMPCVPSVSQNCGTSARLVADLLTARICVSRVCVCARANEHFDYQN